MIWFGSSRIDKNNKNKTRMFQLRNMLSNLKNMATVYNSSFGNRVNANLVTQPK